MDDASSGALDQTVTDVFGYSYPQLPYTRAGEYSLSTFDIPVIVNDNPQIGNAARTLGGARNPRNINLDLSLREVIQSFARPRPVAASCLECIPLCRMAWGGPSLRRARASSMTRGRSFLM
jgi:hypothetical protein